MNVLLNDEWRFPNEIEDKSLWGPTVSCEGDGVAIDSGGTFLLCGGFNLLALSASGIVRIVRRVSGFV